jgi:hypothetical protein
MQSYARTVLVVGLAASCASCLTRSGFERREAVLRCAVHDECRRRTCAALGVSTDANDRELHALTCPVTPRDCDGPNHGDWYSEPPPSNCYVFHRPAAERCLADLERLLASRQTTTSAREPFCGPGPASCAAVYSEIEWPDCPLEK